MTRTTLALCLAGAALAATAAPAHAGHGNDLLKFAPDTSQMVIVLDVADARSSTLLQKGYAALLAAQPDAKAKLAELGLDPLKDIDTVLMAGATGDQLGPDGVKNMVVIVEGRLPKDRMAKIPDVKVSTYQGVAIYTTKDTEIALINNRAFFTKPGAMKGEVDLVLGKGKAKGKSVAASSKAKALRDAIAATDTNAHIWASVLVPAKAAAPMGANMAPKTVGFGLTLTADVAASVKVGMATADAAKQTVAMVQSSLAQVSQSMGTFGLAKAAKSLLVTQDGAFVNLSVTITEAELTSIMNLAKMASGH